MKSDSGSKIVRVAKVLLVAIVVYWKSLIGKAYEQKSIQGEKS